MEKKAYTSNMAEGLLKVTAWASFLFFSSVEGRLIISPEKVQNTTGVKVNNMQTSLPGSTLSNAGHHVHLVQRVKQRVVGLQTFRIFVACVLMLSLGFEEKKL